MILDLANNPLASYTGTISSEGDQDFSMQIDCVADYFLSCDTVGDLAVEARILGDVSYVDIETTPIDLTPYDGERKTIEMRLTAGLVTERVRRQFALRVAK